MVNSRVVARLYFLATWQESATLSATFLILNVYAERKEAFVGQSFRKSRTKETPGVGAEIG